jgi:hypothetical protein
MDLWRRFAAAREPLIAVNTRARPRARAASPGPLFDVPMATPSSEPRPLPGATG